MLDPAAVTWSSMKLEFELGPHAYRDYFLVEQERPEPPLAGRFYSCCGEQWMSFDHTNLCGNSMLIDIKLEKDGSLQLCHLGDSAILRADKSLESEAINGLCHCQR